MPVEWLHLFARSRWAIHSVIGHIFAPSGVIAKRTASLDAAHRIGLPTSPEAVLIVVGALFTAGVKKTRKLVTSAFISPPPRTVHRNR